MSRYSHIKSTIKTTTNFRQSDHVPYPLSYEQNIEKFQPSAKTFQMKYISDDYSTKNDTKRNENRPNISNVGSGVKSCYLNGQNTSEPSLNYDTKMNFLNYNSMSPYKSSFSFKDSYSSECNLRYQIISSNLNIFPTSSLQNQNSPTSHRINSRVDPQSALAQPTSFRQKYEKDLFNRIQQQFALKNEPNDYPNNAQTSSNFNDNAFHSKNKASQGNFGNTQRKNTQASLIDAICSKYRPETEKNPDWDTKFKSADPTMPSKTDFSKDSEVRNIKIPSEENTKNESPHKINSSSNFNFSPSKNALSNIVNDNKKDLFSDPSSSADDEKPKKIVQRVNSSVVLKDGNNKMIDIKEKLAKFRETISIVRKTEEDFGDLLKSDTETEIRQNEDEKNPTEIKESANEMLSEPSLIFDEQEQRSEHQQETK